MLIDIFVPGLFDVPVYELEQDQVDNDFKSLEKIFRFGRAVETNISNFDHFISSHMNGESVPPYVQLYADDENTKSILARPMHFKTDMQNAHLIPIATDHRSQQDCRVIIEALANLFADDFTIQEQNYFTWLVSFKSLNAPQNYPHPYNVLGRKINPYVEQSRENLDWYRLNNEIQMFLHQHEINAARLLDGLPIINGLWFWGANKASTVGLSGDVYWIVDDPEINNYLEVTGSKTLTEFDVESKGKKIAVVHLAILKALKGYQSQPLITLIRQLEITLIEPALKAIQQHGATIRLNAGAGKCWQYSTRSHWCFWKKPENYMQMLITNMHTEA